ncbi:MAG: long-chain fatty acid--CoA ligase [Alphaproteobacteria bacterium]|nr:long-chain fatty acid--CoA ligase [Alphaproteobacteria bacterium]
MPYTDHGWTNLPAIMLARAREWPAKPLFRFWRGKAWQNLTWAEFADQVAALAAFLRSHGIAPGDRVLLVSENRPEFPIADTAIMAIGAITVPTYVTNLPSDHAHILRDSGARFAIVSTTALAERVLEGAALAHGLDGLLCCEAPPEAPGLVRHLWADALATPADPLALEAETHHIASEALACLIYTSGTGGAPKGVMLPHRALLANRRGVLPLAEKLELDGKPYLSFLPLSHSYEHTVGGFLLPSYGMEVVYSRGADRLVQEMAEIRPAIMTAVPRLFEVLRSRLLAALEKEKPIKRKLFDRALLRGQQRLAGASLGVIGSIEDALLEKLVRKKVRARFGGALRALVSGGARLDPDLAAFFIALGLPVLQGYGQSEAGPVVSVNLPWANRHDSVGMPLGGVECRIAADGEILIQGDLVMTGYWGKAEATASTLKTEGDDPRPWLHTGDIGDMCDGFLYITDRKRDFIKLLGGDMISPAKIESLLMAEPEIQQALVAGEGKPGLVALIVPAEGQEAGIATAVARVNGRLAVIERMRRHAVTTPFTIENGLLTPTMKLKRRAAIEQRAAEIERLWE